MEFIQLMWYAYKRRKYEKLIAKMTKKRERIKATQMKYTNKYEEYNTKFKNIC